MKKIIILGISGSIGKSAVDILRQYPQQFQLCAASVHQSEEKLLELAREFKIDKLCLSGGPASSTKIQYHGQDALLKMIKESEADLVLNAISGAAGLLPSFVSLESGKDLALANKESIVMAGPLLLKKAGELGKKILPVDSEHSALFQLLSRQNKDDVKELLLTASGGPFRERELSGFADITFEEAVKHPRWDMGWKISVDSATMANKGLEVIEAFYLFSLPPEKIKVVIHPQSYVHSMLKTREGSYYAQISYPDMRIPILNAFSYPEVLESPYGELDIFSTHIDFFPVEKERYPLLFTAFRALHKAGGGIIFNAANEEAVYAFKEGKIRFTDIAAAVDLCLLKVKGRDIQSLDDVLELDKESRNHIENILEHFILI